MKHVDLIRVTPRYVGGDDVRLLHRVPVGDPEIGIVEREWGHHVRVSAPHEMADCPFPPDDGMEVDHV